MSNFNISDVGNVLQGNFCSTKETNKQQYLLSKSNAGNLNKIKQILDESLSELSNEEKENVIPLLEKQITKMKAIGKEIPVQKFQEIVQNVAVQVQQQKQDKQTVAEKGVPLPASSQRAGENPKQLEKNFKNEFPVSIRSGTETGKLCQKLENTLKSMTPSQIAILAKTESFWIIITDPDYSKVAATSLSAEALGKLVENPKDLRRAASINTIVEKMDPEDPNLGEKLRAIAETGYLGLHEKTFKIKANSLGESGKKIVETWQTAKKEIRQEYAASRPAEAIPAPKPIPAAKPSAAAKQPITQTPAAPTPMPATPLPTKENWSKDKLQDFIKSTLSAANKEECFRQLESMDDDSIKRFTELIGNDDKALQNLWAFEQQVASGASSIEKRQHRLEIIFSNLDLAQIDASTKMNQFWAILGNTTDGYADSAAKGFSPEQLARITSAVKPGNLAMATLPTLVDKIPVPEREADRVPYREKLSAIKDTLDNLKFPTSAIMSKIRAKEPVLRRAGT